MQTLLFNTNVKANSMTVHGKYFPEIVNDKSGEDDFDFSVN